MVNLSCGIAFHARTGPEKEAIVFEGSRITYSELSERIETVAGWLLANDVGPDGLVAVLMKNSAAFVEIAMAVSHAGAILLPINYRLSRDEVTYILHDAGASFLIVDEELFHPDFPGRVVRLPPCAQGDSRGLTGAAPRASPVDRLPSDTLRIMYTSGTTDRPKGVVHTYDNFHWRSADHTLAFGLDADTRLLIVGPLFHVGGFDFPGVSVLMQGGTICIQRDFDPEAVLGAFEREGVTGAWLAPVMTGSILACPNRHDYDVTSVRWVVGGGERTPEARIRSFGTFFANARYIDAYGLTESCGGDTLMEAGWELTKIGSVGRPLPHVAVEIRADDGQRLAAGRHGEICLRGPKVCRTYWRDADKTRQSFHGEWLRTGDVGYLDEDGFLFVTDRKKDIIISGAENVASAEVERVIYELSAVREAAVIGVPDERWGERVVAVVALAEGAALDLAELQAHCRGKLGGFKIPRGLVIRERLPRNPTGKVLKRVLREELA